MFSIVKCYFISPVHRLSFALCFPNNKRFLLFPSLEGEDQGHHFASQCEYEEQTVYGKLGNSDVQTANSRWERVHKTLLQIFHN